MNSKIRRPILNNSVGIGLRSFHHQYVLENQPEVPWLEIHGENFFSKGGSAIYFIKKIRELYPLSIHCVGLSLGSSDEVNKKHLRSLKELIKITDPFLVSDHISWSNIDNVVLNDLLPIPYTKEALEAICKNIEITQNFLGREIMVENPSAYLNFKQTEFSEPEFINKISQKTGCKILLDINNIYVSSQNNRFNPKKYLDEINKDIVGEMHLAGHNVKKLQNGQILVDTHNDYVCDEVWDLFKIAAKKFNNAPTLIEWDQDFPEFSELQKEAKKAEEIINKAT